MPWAQDLNAWVWAPGDRAKVCRATAAGLNFGPDATGEVFRVTEVHAPYLTGLVEHRSPFRDSSGRGTVTTRHIERCKPVVRVRAEQPHRLLLPEGVAYSMSIFTTGPRRRTWGFHYPDGWRPFDDVSEIIDGVSVHKELLP